jgi:hypothetical protein
MEGVIVSQRMLLELDYIVASLEENRYRGMVVVG